MRIVDATQVDLSRIYLTCSWFAPIFVRSYDGGTAVIAQFKVGVLVDVVAGDRQRRCSVARHFDAHAGIARNHVARDPRRADAEPAYL